MLNRALEYDLRRHTDEYPEISSELNAIVYSPWGQEYGSVVDSVVGSAYDLGYEGMDLDREYMKVGRVLGLTEQIQDSWREGREDGGH